MVPQPEAPVEVPDMSVFDVAEDIEEQPAEEPEPVQPEPEPASEPEPVPEPEEEAEEDSSGSMFDDEWSGNEMADAVSAAEKQLEQIAKRISPSLIPTQQTRSAALCSI